MTDAALIASLRRELAIARRLNDDLIAVLGPMNEVALACGRPKLTSDPTDIPYPEIGTGRIPTNGRVLPRRDQESVSAPALLCGVGAGSNKSAAAPGLLLSTGEAVGTGVAPSRAHHRGAYSQEVAA